MKLRALALVIALPVLLAACVGRPVRPGLPPEQVAAAEPDNAAIIDSYGWVLYRLGRNQEALTELRRAFALQEDAEIAAHLGEVLWVLGKRDEARRYFEEARKLDPENRALQRALEKFGLRSGGEA